MRFSDLKKGILTLMDTEKRIQRFSKIIIADLAAKSVQENNCFCEHLIYGKLLRISIKKLWALRYSAVGRAFSTL